MCIRDRPGPRSARANAADSSPEKGGRRRAESQSTRRAARPAKQAFRAMSRAQCRRSEDPQPTHQHAAPDTRACTERAMRGERARSVHA
eukprot:12074524-Alexandrium_andersonii.AAC.1